MSEHKSATELLHAVLAVVPDGEKVAELFAEDGALELPYLHSFGMETRYEGTRPSPHSTSASRTSIRTSDLSPRIRPC